MHTQIRIRTTRCALDAPSAATNSHVHFEALRRQSEESLRLLRIDIFEIRQALVEEGVRLRSLQEDEVHCPPYSA